MARLQHLVSSLGDKYFVVKAFGDMRPKWGNFLKKIKSKVKTTAKDIKEAFKRKMSKDKEARAVTTEFQWPPPRIRKAENARDTRTILVDMLQQWQLLQEKLIEQLDDDGAHETATTGEESSEEEEETREPQEDEIEDLYESLMAAAWIDRHRSGEARARLEL
ncbi:hypothetical protein TWF696_002450 [Orbilia brochopaga]|uniref:Uncharacterized protein n=1 Tax=Orbilia brochopaga TaxID=3140254 RepID=A0AAV9U7A7_9PEZI